MERFCLIGCEWHHASRMTGVESAEENVFLASAHFQEYLAAIVNASLQVFLVLCRECLADFAAVNTSLFLVCHLYHKTYHTVFRFAPLAVEEEAEPVHIR